MRYLLRPALLLAALAGAAAPVAPLAADVVPGIPSAEVEIGGVLGRWDRARAQHDERVLDEILASDFVATGPASGSRLTRADILAGRALENGARLAVRERLDVRLSGDTATAHSLVNWIGTRQDPTGGRMISETVTLRREGDRWLLVGSRSALAGEVR
jgi:ketosteroid isomerase-like protein